MDWIDYENLRIFPLLQQYIATEKRAVIGKCPICRRLFILKPGKTSCNLCNGQIEKERKLIKRCNDKFIKKQKEQGKYRKTIDGKSFWTNKKEEIDGISHTTNTKHTD